MGAPFASWIDTLLDEKGIDPELRLDVEGPSGLNSIPVACLVDLMKTAPAHEQRGIRDMVVLIDFRNGDVLDYFRHLARAVAL
jgi:hypothetical protein